MLFMLKNSILLLSTVIFAQTIAAPQEVAKSKRHLNYYNDLIGPPPPPQHINSLVHIKPSTIVNPLHHSRYPKFTNVFGFDDITYQHIFNNLNGYGYPTVPTHITPPVFETPSIFSNGYGYVNYGAARDFDTAYIAHDGRIVKQYAVHEHHANDLPDTVGLRPRPTNAGQGTPSQIPLLKPPNFAQPRNFNVNTKNDVPTFLNKNHGPIALGSGSLGFIRGPNGEVYLGSGSLGYISHSDHYNNVMNIVNRREQAQARGSAMF
ncbi:uncharacterized protein [Chironomus tepperi]|uniref:uncharacterized protein n=1 Tax=Chironomus tepperi TaxID=113505 RepID=UPI00391FBD56